MSMYMYEGTNAVRSARITTAVLAINLVVAGILLFIYGISDLEDWAVKTGIALALACIPFLLSRERSEVFRASRELARPI